MAHYDNFAARAIDYSNRQIFEGFFDFIIHRKSAWDAYMDYYRPEPDVETHKTVETDFNTPILDVGNPFVYNAYFNENAWAALAFFHYMSGFLFRLMLLPIAGVVYTLSRTSLIVLNPLAWRNNPWKAFSMSMVWVIPTLFALNNHVHHFLPDLAFNTPFTLSNFQDVSSAFGMSQGAWGMGASAIGGLIVSTFLALGMACFLHLAKKAAQSKNAVVFADPLQKNLMDPDTVLITAPKNRPIELMPVEPQRNRMDDAEWAKHKDRQKENNPYNEYNLASGNFLYMYYKEKKPAIWGSAPKRVKNMLNAFNAVNATHGSKDLEINATKLTIAYTELISQATHVDRVEIETRNKYRIDLTLNKYETDFDKHVLKKVR